MTKLNENILALRRAAGMTQDQLSQQLGVTYQAVSKWENAQACPDVELLPQLADLFGVTLDALFGREAEEKSAAQADPFMEELPWGDEDILHIAVFRGRNVVNRRQLDQLFEKEEIGYITLDGKTTRVDSMLSLKIEGDVSGNATAGRNMSIGGDVGGSANCGSSMSIGGDVEGDAQSGGSQSIAGDVEGDAHCGGTQSIVGDVGGSVHAQNAKVSIHGDVEGDIRAEGGDVRVEGDVGGDVSVREGDVYLEYEPDGDVHVEHGKAQPEVHSGKAHVPIEIDDDEKRKPWWFSVFDK